MFTITTEVYWGLPLFKQTIESILNQTYKNIELIIVNNGASKEIISYINRIKEQDERVVIISYEENKFSWDDPLLYVVECGNAALKAAKGDYFFRTSYDDPLSLDYVERMVRLFENNPKCTTAAGRPVSIDMDNNVNEEELNNRKSNFRPTYMPGHILALETLKGKQQNMFSAPGVIFTIKRDVFLNYGGFHRSVELSQLYGIVPLGETGFDEDAIYYWRRHEGQLNKILNARGTVFVDDTISLLRDWEIEKRWQVFGKDTAREVVTTITRDALTSPADWFYFNLSSLRVRSSLRIIRGAWKHPYFWYMVSIMPFKKPEMIFIHTIKHIGKVVIRGIFKYFPELTNASPGFARLYNRVNR